MTEPESFLSRLRSLDREANDAPWRYDYEGPDSLLADAHSGYVAEVQLQPNGDLDDAVTALLSKVSGNG